MRRQMIDINKVISGTNKDTIYYNLSVQLREKVRDPRLIFFFFNDTAPTEISPLPLHDALPIWVQRPHHGSERDVTPPQRGLQLLCRPDGEVGRGALQTLGIGRREAPPPHLPREDLLPDRKSTRLNSSHSQISYAVFCLKKKIHINDRRRPAAFVKQIAFRLSRLQQHPILVFPRVHFLGPFIRFQIDVPGLVFSPVPSTL